MKTSFSFEGLFRADAPAGWSQHVAHTVSSLIRTARLALENDTSGLCGDNEKFHAVADTLEIAEALNSIVIDGTDKFEIAFQKEAEA
jgi:hypothetical protein|tara:strand:+ start:947 stop:1207 length:261 start_codon:yes stop_codon:yes gene_type:complete